MNQPIHPSINPSIDQSINPSIHQPINPSVHQSINPSILKRPFFHQDTLTGRFGYHVASLKTKLQSFPSKADYTHDPTNKLRHPPRKINMRALGICLLLALD